VKHEPFLPPTRCRCELAARTKSPMAAVTPRRARRSFGRILKLGGKNVNFAKRTLMVAGAGRWREFWQ
jgi:hypothetical protein